MWDMQVSCHKNANEQLAGSGKLDMTKDLIAAIPATYYAGISQPIILDKCREWAHPANVQMILDYLDPNPKMIVTDRNLLDVVKSYVYIRKMNDWTDPEANVLDEGSEPIMRAFRATQWAKRNNDGKFLFVDYDRLITEPESVIADIYDFCDWQPFQHDFTNIVNPHPNRDRVYMLFGLHDIRPTISRRQLDVELSPELEEKARVLID